MYNRVKFVINKFLSQNSNKKDFVKIKKYNKKYPNSSGIITRKFSSYKNPKPPSNDYLLIIIAFSCGLLFSFKKK